MKQERGIKNSSDQRSKKEKCEQTRHDRDTNAQIGQRKTGPDDIKNVKLLRKETKIELIRTFLEQMSEMLWTRTMEGGQRLLKPSNRKL